MSDTRFATSDQATCPACGHDTAIVRVRGNAFAATCVACRHTQVGPMLTGHDLDAVPADCAGVLLQMLTGRVRRARELPERELPPVRFELS